ncbi:MAG: acyltransferase family protein [Cyclobacteriaceae bacterium]
MQKPNINFENLDGLRFICFLSVFLFHSFHTNYEYIKEEPVYSFVKWNLFGNGNLGVNFFFVLSGFLITYLLLKEKEFFGRINIISFWKRRILRIWPLFYFCVFFGFVIFPLIKSIFGQTPNETANLNYYILFLNNFDFIRNGLPDASILGVLWSVAIEEQFYLIWPLIVYFFSPRTFFFLILFIIAGSIVFRSFYFDNYNEIEYSTFSCIGDLAMGSFGALLTQKTEIKNWIVNLNIIIIIMIYCCLIVLFLFRKEIYACLGIFKMMERTWISILFLMVILEQSYAKHSFFKMSNLKVFSRLGIISYGLYCLHFIGILAATTITSIMGWNKFLWQVIFLETFMALALTIFFSKMSYLYFELPFLRINRRLSRFTKD